MLQDAPPRVLPVGQQDLWRRGSRINRGFYCCQDSRCLQYKATVMFKGTSELGTLKSRVLRELCGTAVAPEVRRPVALVQTHWHRNAASLGRKPFLRATEMLQLTRMLLKHNSIPK